MKSKVFFMVLMSMSVAITARADYSICEKQAVRIVESVLTQGKILPSVPRDTTITSYLSSGSNGETFENYEIGLKTPVSYNVKMRFILEEDMCVLDLASLNISTE